ncbi:MAG: tyrosine-type recombinase/integrase [Haloplanus sp.]
MDECIQRYLDRVKGLKAQGTYNKRKTDLRQFSEWAEEVSLNIPEMDPLEVEQYFLHLKEQGYAPNTIAGKYDSIYNFYDMLSGKLGYIEDNPLEELTRSDYVEKNTKKHDETDITYITPDEMEALAEHVPAPKVRNELMVRLLWQTGIRACELVEMELDDIDREERSIDIWSPKTKESRTVFYQPSLDLLMDQWLDMGYRSSHTYAAESDYVFVTRQSGQFRPENVNDMILEAAENAGIQEVMYRDQAGQKRHRVTAHALRHGHAVHALRCDIDVRTVQKHLGHADLDMTMKYLQLVKKDVQEKYHQRFGIEQE